MRFGDVRHPSLRVETSASPKVGFKGSAEEEGRGEGKKEVVGGEQGGRTSASCGVGGGVLLLQLKKNRKKEKKKKKKKVLDSRLPPEGSFTSRARPANPRQSPHVSVCVCSGGRG